MKNTKPFGIGLLLVLRQAVKRLAWLCVLWPSLCAHAFELGALRLESGSGQTATGHIVIKGEIAGGQLMAWIVSPDGYRAAGLNPQHSMQGVRITPYRTATGESWLRLDAIPLVPSRYDLLVIAGDSSGAKVGNYHIDANVGAREIPVAPISNHRLGSAEPRHPLARKAGAARGAAAAAAPSASAPRAADVVPAVDSERRDQLAQVGAAVEAWRQAWSAKDFDAYIAAYAPTYAGRVAGRSRDDWLDERRQRILARRAISVEVDDLRLTERDDNIVATFDQTYRADDLLLRSRKQLTLAPGEDGRWLIVGEIELR
jgi:hypothetical protein